MIASRGHWRASKPFVYVVVNLAVFTDAYFYGVIIPVLPFALTEVIEIEQENVQWWIGALLAAYGAGLLVGAPIVGYYADRSESRRGPYLLGLIFLALSTVAISLGRTMAVLLAGRVVQGVSSASVHAVGMAILADTAGDDGVGPAMGFVTMMMSLGAVLGPMFGGLLYHQLGYFAVFSSAYVLVGVDFVLRLLMVEKQGRRLKDGGDSYGTFSKAPAAEGLPETMDAADYEDNISCSALSNSLSSMDPSQNPCAQEQRTTSPILLLLASPRMLSAILCDFMQSLILTGLETVLPLRIKNVFNYNSQDVAFVFLVLALPYAAGPLTGRLGDLYGAKKVICAGFGCLMPLILLLRVIDHYEAGQVALLCVLLFAIGTAMNMVLTPAWSDTIHLVKMKSEQAPEIFGEKGAYAQAFGLLNMAYAVGSVLGPLMGGWLIQEVGWNRLTLGGGILCGVCVIPCMLYTGDKTQKNNVSSVDKDVNDNS